MTTEYVTPQLRTVLKTYQCTATKSLQGPGISLATHPHKKEISSPDSIDEPQIVPLQPPELPQPILSVADTEHGTLHETLLEGKPIACFPISGEMRLCVPQIFNTILTSYQLEQINKYCDELQISCSQCSPEQLNEFKAAKILPENISSCGLITRTNAERLCSAVLHHPDNRSRHPMKGSISFKVYHRCFGKCEGLLTPDLYTSTEPSCIECLDCHGMFSPQKFVCHAHYNRETQICHWGFDSTNWRAYLHVTLDEINIEKYTAMLDEIRDREKLYIGYSNIKRKAVFEETHNHLPCKTEPIDIPPKKVKRHDSDAYQIDYLQQALIIAQYQHQHMAAFRPWAPQGAAVGPKHLPHLSYPAGIVPYLNQDPPILQNPERVIRQSESERFERSYQPNVALLPRRHSNSKDRDKERTRIIPTEVQIKQERPNTPVSPAVVNSPELRVSPENVESAPFSPEASRGSNEITSSTSPVLQLKNDHSVATPCERSPVPSEAIRQNIHRNSISHLNQSPIIMKNGGSSAIGGNPEFELSTDTDDDSFTGEPDSSNSNVPLEIAADILKTARQDDRDKILQIIKMLVHENIQLRHAHNHENQSLLEEIRRKDEQIADLLVEKRHLEESLKSKISLSPVEPVIVAKPENKLEQSSERDSKLPPSPQSHPTPPPPPPQTVNNHINSFQYSRNDKSDVIMKPLKKSLRRTPPEELSGNTITTNNSVIMHQQTIKLEPPSTPPIQQTASNVTTNYTTSSTNNHLQNNIDSSVKSLPSPQQIHHHSQLQQQHIHQHHLLNTSNENNTSSVNRLCNNNNKNNINNNINNVLDAINNVHLQQRLSPSQLQHKNNNLINSDDKIPINNCPESG